LPESHPLSNVRARPSLLRLVFASEKVPSEARLEASACDPRPSLARVLFARETLPREPCPNGASHSRWFAWLFSPERIDGT
jgi:hypothetical protein